MANTSHNHTAQNAFARQSLIERAAYETTVSKIVDVIELIEERLSRRLTPSEIGQVVEAIKKKTQ